MRIYKQADFEEWANEECIMDIALIKAIKEIEQGLVDASLGACLYKKRVAREGQGKSGGYRTLIAFKEGNRAIFVYGFAKNERDNIGDKEKKSFKNLARHYLNLSDIEIMVLVKEKVLKEILK